MFRAGFLRTKILHCKMKLIKTSEKILIWMHRNNISGQKIACEIGITRQAWSGKIRDNIFTPKDMLTIKRMGFNE